MRWYRVDDMDAREASVPPVQDPELRRLVDWLPPIRRHLITRTFFGGVFLAHAAREVGLPKRMARNQRDAGLAQLQVWLTEGGAPEGEPEVVQEFVFLDTVDCTAEDMFDGRLVVCKQPAVDGELCAAHLEWLNSDIKPDREYLRAVMEGRKTPVQAFLSTSEMDALTHGRFRGDGRRLDQYTTFDSLDGAWDGP